MFSNRLAFAAALLSCCIGPARAMPENITAGELALTPEFCQDVQTINGWSQYGRESPRSPHWVRLMGRSFWDMHHYCWALINLNRARSPGVTPQYRDHLIHSAISDYYYVVKAAVPTFVMLPEIFYRIGDAHAQLGEVPLAMQAFTKSREYKADYWPPYVGQAKLLEKVGMKSDAKKVLEEGLRLMPNEPALQTPYLRLGGKLSDIRPVARPAAPPAPASASAAIPAPASAPQGAASTASASQ